MNKTILLLLVTSCTIGIIGYNVSTFAQNNKAYPNEFINALQYCKPYTYSIGPVDMMGMKVTTKKQILGVRNGLCSYVEVVGPPDAKNIIRCNFTQSQINRLVSATRNNVSSGKPISVSFNDSKQINVTGGDSASRLWTEYLNNSSVCKTQTPGWD